MCLRFHIRLFPGCYKLFQMQKCLPLGSVCFWSSFNSMESLVCDRGWNCRVEKCEARGVWWGGVYGGVGYMDFLWLFLGFLFFSVMAFPIF